MVKNRLTFFALFQQFLFRIVIRLDDVGENRLQTAQHTLQPITGVEAPDWLRGSGMRDGMGRRVGGKTKKGNGVGGGGQATEGTKL